MDRYRIIDNALPEKMVFRSGVVAKLGLKKCSNNDLSAGAGSEARRYLEDASISQALNASSVPENTRV